MATKSDQMSPFLTFVSPTYVITFMLLILARNVIAVRFQFGFAYPEVR